VGLGHHPPAGSAIIQGGVAERQAGRGWQVGFCPDRRAFRAARVRRPT
jgi:hypothetical protein